MSLSFQRPGSRLKPVALENVRIAAPCPTTWENMAGDDSVRFCAECKLNVYNLSNMTPREAERLIAHREGRLCVRLYQRADGTMITQNCPRGLRLLMERVSRVAGAALSAMMSLSIAVAQAPQQNNYSQPSQKEPMQDGLSLLILDPQGAAIPGATVYVSGHKPQAQWIARSDANGTAIFSGLPPGKYALKVEVNGFKSLRQNVKVEKGKPIGLRLKMKIAETMVVVGMLEEDTLLDRTNSQVTHVFKP